MRIITRKNSKIHYDYEGRKTRQYRVIQEYSRYYLCECIQNGKALYRECFLKVDVNGIKEVPKTMEPRVGWHM